MVNNVSGDTKVGTRKIAIFAAVSISQRVMVLHDLVGKMKEDSIAP